MVAGRAGVVLARMDFASAPTASAAQYDAMGTAAFLEAWLVKGHAVVEREAVCPRTRTSQLASCRRHMDAVAHRPRLA